MERLRPIDQNRVRGPGDDGPSDDRLQEHREDIEALLEMSDHVFDSINNLQAQQYLEQNVQTGGQ